MGRHGSRELRPRSATIIGMANRREALLEEALHLDESERAELAGALLQSLEPPADVQVEQAWREEVDRRLDDVQAGRAQFTPWEQVRERLLLRLNERR